MKKDWLILYLGTDTWTVYEGTLEDAIKHVKTDHRFRDYGRDGALIYSGQLKYQISMEAVERWFPEKETQDAKT